MALCFVAYNACLNLLLLDYLLCYLYCVESCTLADLVAYTPESDTILISQVLTDTTYIHIVCSTQIQWHWIRVLRVESWIIHYPPLAQACLKAKSWIMDDGGSRFNELL